MRDGSSRSRSRTRRAIVLALSYDGGCSAHLSVLKHEFVRHFTMAVLALCGSHLAVLLLVLLHVGRVDWLFALRARHECVHEIHVLLQRVRVHHEVARAAMGVRGELAAADGLGALSAVHVQSCTLGRVQSVRTHRDVLFAVVALARIGISSGERAHGRTSGRFRLRAMIRRHFAHRDGERGIGAIGLRQASNKQNE